MKTFHIAKTGDLGGIPMIMEFSKVTPEIFWDTLETKIKSLKGCTEEKYNSLMEQIKPILDTGKSLTVAGAAFQIKTKRQPKTK